ncbi:MAG: EamA family transporter, partial [Polyangiaceae bacterium]
MTDSNAPSVPAATRVRALFGLIGCCALWGLSFPVIKALGLHLSAQAPGINTWFASAATVVVRFGCGAVCLFALGWSRPTRGEWAQGLGLGVSSAIGMLLQMDALNFSSASTSAFLTQGYILILPLVAAATARALPPTKTIVCVLLSAIGLAILSGFDWGGVHLGRGESETLLAACSFAVQILCLDAKRYRGNRARVVTTVMFAGVAVLLTPVALGTMRGIADLGVLFGTPMAVGLVLVLTVPCTIVAFSLMNRYQPEVSASEAGIIYCVEPMFASLFALFLPGIVATLAHIEYANEVLSTRLLLGGGLLISANVLL